MSMQDRLARRAAAPRGFTVNNLMRALVAEIEAEDDELPDVTRQDFCLAFVWVDLCRLAGEEPPPEILAALDEPAVARLLSA